MFKIKRLFCREFYHILNFLNNLPVEPIMIGFQIQTRWEKLYTFFSKRSISLAGLVYIHHLHDMDKPSPWGCRFTLYYPFTQVSYLLSFLLTLILPPLKTVVFDLSCKFFLKYGLIGEYSLVFNMWKGGCTESYISWGKIQTLIVPSHKPFSLLICLSSDCPIWSHLEYISGDIKKIYTCGHFGQRHSSSSL